jgi:hypothetical protein
MATDRDGNVVLQLGERSLGILRSMLEEEEAIRAKMEKLAGRQREARLKAVERIMRVEGLDPAKLDGAIDASYLSTIGVAVLGATPKSDKGPSHYARDESGALVAVQ